MIWAECPGSALPSHMRAGRWSQSVIAIVTRKGNPMGIEDWGDLARKDVFSVCANPKTAGGARWNFLALWGHKMAQVGRDPHCLTAILRAQMRHMTAIM